MMGKKLHSEEEKLFLKQFGLNVRKLRKKFNIPQAEMAFRMVMTTQTLSDIENGKTNCQQTTAYLMAKALGIEMYKLYIFEDRGWNKERDFRIIKYPDSTYRTNRLKK